MTFVRKSGASGRTSVVVAHGERAAGIACAGEGPKKALKSASSAAAVGDVAVALAAALTVEGPATADGPRVRVDDWKSDDDLELDERFLPCPSNLAWAERVRRCFFRSIA